MKVHPLRLFVALSLTSEIRQRLAILRGSMPNVQWAPIENYHLTLRFIGEITDRHILEEIDYRLLNLSWKPFDLTLSGAEILKGISSDKLIIKVLRSDALFSLQSKLETLLRQAGCSPIKRRFHPHITIGHTQPSQREEAAHWVQRHNLFRSPNMTIDTISLFESLRSDNLPVYISRAQYSWDPNLILPIDEE